MLTTIALIVAVLIMGILIATATRPDTFTIERTGTVNAPPEKVFPFIDDFKRWDAWSPWEKKDPAMQRSFGAITSGKGATYAWSGNKDVGQGSMEITESEPSSRVALKLDFLKPFEAHNAVDFTLTPAASGTDVRWRMQGRNNFIAKIMHMFMNIDKMVGKDFEAGLANLKAAAET